MRLITVAAPPPAPPRPQQAHKGTFGTVIVVGGCSTMMGAPAICATGALRSGVGLVKIAAHPSVLPAAIGIQPSATAIVLGDNLTDNLWSLDQADPHQQAVLAVGPGIGQSEPAQQLVTQLLQGTRTVVLDADGLNLLAQNPRPRLTANPHLVMTPHPGEFARLAKPRGIAHNPTDPDARAQAAAALATTQHATVVLKGHHTVVCDGQHGYTNTTGNPALATAGCGDVLTGLIAALIAQGMKPFDASVLGVYLHGLAADQWANQHGQSGLTAMDLANRLPHAFQFHRRDEQPDHAT